MKLNSTLFLFLLNLGFLFAQKQTIVADSLYTIGQYSKSISEYKKIKLNANSFQKIGNAYLELGNYNLAIENFKQSLKLTPDNYVLRFRYAKLLSKLKRYIDAKESFFKLLSEDATNPSFHYEMGMLKQKMKDTTAIVDLKKAYALDAQHLKSVIAIAKVYMKNRKFEKANSYLSKGIKLAPKNNTLISLKAQVLYLQKEYESAIFWFEKLLSNGQSSAFIHKKTGICYQKEWKYEIAIFHLEKVLEFEPDDTEIMLVLGDTYNRIDEYEKAEFYILKAIKILHYPLDREYTKLGAMANFKGKHAQALLYLKKAIKENPDNQQAHFFLLNTLEKHFSDNDKRIKLLQNFQDQFPKSIYAKNIAQRLQKAKETKFQSIEKQ